MSINRVFLDWKRPGLPAAVDWLIAKAVVEIRQQIQKSNSPEDRK